MLAIRMQRTGRRGHAQFRVVVQESQFSPTSGRVVALLGSYNPHTKEVTLDTDKASSYIANGAQPSERVARLLEKEGVKLPGWVKPAAQKKRGIKKPEKLRRNQPETPKAEEPTAPEAEAGSEEPSTAEAPAEEVAKEDPEEPAAAKEDVKPDTPGTEKPAEEPAAEPEVKS